MLAVRDYCSLSDFCCRLPPPAHPVSLGSTIEVCDISIDATPAVISGASFIIPSRSLALGPVWVMIATASPYSLACTHWGCRSTTPAVGLTPEHRSNGLSKQSRCALFAFASPFQPRKTKATSITALATRPYWLSAALAASRLDSNEKFARGGSIGQCISHRGDNVASQRQQPLSVDS